VSFLPSGFARETCLGFVSNRWAVLEAQLIFLPMLLIKKGRNNGNQETLQRRKEVRQSCRQVSKERDASKEKGTLKSGKGGRGGTVKSRKPAIAIGLSEARKKGE
jgi:hypothetical protein